MNDIMRAHRQLFRCAQISRSCLPYLTSRANMTQPQRQPLILRSETPIEEERMPGYRPEYFYPAGPGQVLNKRYKILTKIGWGAASTVWLAEDLEQNPVQHVTVKITTSNPDYGDKIFHELDINKILIKNTSRPGFAFIRSAIDNFIAVSPSGTAHLCLVFEAMREPINQFQHRLIGDRISFQLLKVYIDFLLQGLEYLHSDCHIIHTDLKADNILMSFEDPNVIIEYIEAQAEHPMPQKTVGDRNIYLSHNDFGPLKSYWMLPKIVDFGLAHQGSGQELLRHPIQPPLYHAPEVLLGIPWSYSADIWNLGVLIFELLEDKELFTNLKSQNGVYTARAHLAEMIALLGLPPSELIEQEELWCEIPWNRSFPDPDGKWCDTARRYYGGPFFDSKGNFSYPDIIPTHAKLDDCITSMVGEEKELFLNFIRKMLQWLPEERNTAKELREHPWLKSGP